MLRTQPMGSALIRQGLFFSKSNPTTFVITNPNHFLFPPAGFLFRFAICYVTCRPFFDTSQKVISPLNLLHSRRVQNGVEHHFVWLFEKVHCPSQYPKTPRLQVAHQVLLGVPFLKKKEPIFILHTPAELATLASLFRPYGADQ